MIIKKKQTSSFYMITLALTIKQLLIWRVVSLSSQTDEELVQCQTRGSGESPQQTLGGSVATLSFVHAPPPTISD